MSLADEKYLALTTYRKNGESSSVPIWIADLGDGSLGFSTNGQSLKVRRIRNDNRVRLQPSDSRGRVKENTAVVDGTAELVHGPDFERVKGAIRDKYGWQVSMIGVFNTVAGLFGKSRASDTGIVITLN